MKFFLDTYALVELIKGNENYKKYVNNELFTSILNLYELFYYLLRSYDEDKAKLFYYQYVDILIPIRDEHVFEASKMKLKIKDLSYTDALGYSIAQKEGIRFLTGDNEFKNLDNVEFVK
ncbi:PIN domain-containing protein [Candidatus Woesearchaeota archaeon]|nr:PIN domain-containing protein [Candidatus Woesearchaeota archaeon]